MHALEGSWINDKQLFWAFQNWLLAVWPPPGLTRPSECLKSLGTKPWAQSFTGLLYPSLLWKTVLKNISATSPSSAASPLPVLPENTPTPQTQYLISASSQRQLYQSQPLHRADLSNQQHWALMLQEQLKLLAHHFWREGRYFKGLRKTLL